MRNDEKDMIEGAFRMFEEQTGIHVEWDEGNGDDDHDGQAKFHFGKHHLAFMIACKKNIQNADIANIEAYPNKKTKRLLVARQITKTAREILRNLNAAYLDEAGNAFLKTKTHFILIEGYKLERPGRIDKNRAFTKAGLKVVFLLLIKPHKINETYREIAAQTGVALDTINKTYVALKELKFMGTKGRRRKILLNPDDLQTRWINAYDTTLKPGLFAGNYRFISKEAMREWKKMDFGGQPTWWGGEPAANAMTGYLNPEIFTIYTDEPQQDLIQKYRIIPDANGPIRVYRTFWEDKDHAEKTVHPFLVYADLISTGNDRNRETAKIIYEQFLENRF
jgi:hypothetical protein